jgi:cystine transport system substrate-binding protein
MKKLIVTMLLVLVMLLTCTGCASAPSGSEAKPATTATQTQETTAAPKEQLSEFDAAIEEILANAKEDSLKRVKDAGVMTVGVEGNWFPYIYYDEKNPELLVGFHVEIAEEVAKLLGIECKFDVASQFDGILAGLQAKRFDIISMGLKDSTIASMPDLTNSHKYNQDMPIIIVHKDNTEIVDIASMNGKKAGNSTTSSYGKIAFNAGCDCNPDLDFAMAMQGISNGTIDLAVNSMVVFNQYMEKYPDSPLKIAFIYEPEKIEDLQGGVTLRAADESLIAAVNLAVDELLENGKVIELATKYLGEEFVKNAALYKDYQ